MTHDDYARYLKVLNALKQNARDGPGGNRTNDDSSMSHLNDFMDLDIDGKSDPSYVMNPGLLGHAQ